MKNIYKFCCLFICCIILASCSEEKKEWDPGIAPGPVTDVTAAVDNGTVVLKWKNPEDISFHYVSISYVGSNGAERGRNISKFAVDPVTGYATEIIEGFGDTKEYEFTLTAHSEGGAASPGVAIAATPLAPVFDILIDKVEVLPDFGGVRVEWENTTGKAANVVIQWVIKGRVERKTIKANETGYDAVEGIPAEATVFKVYTTDAFENQSVTKEYTLTPYEESLIPKSGWSIPGYNSGSAAGTIGYSSQAVNEGDKNKATAIFDDDVNTFWHASWSNPSTNYPHWIIVDLGKEITISRIELTRRQGNGKGQKGQQILTCKAADAVDQANSDNWNWEDHGTSAFKIDQNTPTSIRLTKNPKARYVKLYFGDGVKGSDNYAMLAEMTVYGSQD
ncbi:MAG: DUF4959 domain-containing protein [Prevotella sp.]|jgi:hypothetical protein|nr:DUF4959 domain-containing protein [Prevotella sp.]